MKTSITLTEYESQSFEDQWVINQGTKRTLAQLCEELDEVNSAAEKLEAHIAMLERTSEEREQRILDGIGQAHGVKIPLGIDPPEKRPENGRIVLSWDAEPKAKAAAKKATKKTTARKPRKKRAKKKAG